jgi:phage FluMu protein gp41
MSTDDLMSRALAALGEIDGPMSVEVIHRLVDTSDVLLEHRDTIRRQIRELTLSLAATEYKIAIYGGTTGDTC